MKGIKLLLLYCLIMAEGAVNVACHHHHGHCDLLDDEITIVNDWSNASEVSPEGIAYLFFPPGSDSPWRFDFPGIKAGEVELPEGDYRFVMFNDDTSHIDFITDQDGEMYVTTPLCGVNAMNDSTYYDGEYVHVAPDMLWCYSIDHVGIHEDYVDYNGEVSFEKRLVTRPRPMTTQYSLLVSHVENLQGVVWMGGAITGQSGKVHLNNYSHDKPFVTVPFDIKFNPDSTLVAQFVTFGVPDKIDIVNKVDLFFLLSDGKKIKAVVDVTNQITDAPSPLNIKLNIDSIKLPWAPPVEIGGGGFAPSVNGWVDVIIDYGEN